MDWYRSMARGLGAAELLLIVSDSEALSTGTLVFRYKNHRKSFFL